MTENKAIKPIVLYVDDESINLRLFKLSFKTEYIVHTASSGEEALEFLKENPADIIISDQRMPGMTGTEFMIEAKKNLPNSKYILLTGYTDIEALEKAINEVGLWQYIKKPWEPSNLKFVIDNAFSNIKTEKENVIISAALEQSEERLYLALEGTNAGVWDWNLKTNQVYFSPTWKSMLGYEENELDNEIKTWENLLHPDDLQFSFQHLDEYFKGSSNKYELEYRMKHKNGDYIHILSRGRGVKSSDGEFERLTGTHIDLTEKYKVQNEIKKLNEELEERVERRTQALKLLNIQLIQRNKFEHLISKISSELIAVNVDKVEEQINSALNDINSFSSADNSFVFKIKRKGIIEVTNECFNSGGVSLIHRNFNGVSINELPLIQSKISSNDVLIIKDVENMTNDFTKEKNLFVDSNIKSILLIPLIFQNELIGCFGISFTNPSREWNQEDISLLKFIGEIFTNAIIRGVGERELLDREKKLSEANAIILDNEKKTKLLQNIASIANSPLKIEDALILSHEIIINQGKGISGLLLRVDEKIERSPYYVMNIIGKTEKEEQNLHDYFNSDENPLKSLVLETIAKKEIISKKDVNFNYNVNTLLSYSFDITSLPVIVGDEILFIFISIFPPGDNGLTEMNILKDISREISFVTERDITKWELKKSLEREKELGELKSQFISMASHQFRTPLTVIQSNVELFQMLAEQIDEALKNKFDKISVRIKEEVVRLTNLMNDVLLLGKLNANVLQANLESLNIKDLITGIIEKLDQIQPDGRKTIFSSNESTGNLLLDENLFSHAFTNLLENAFKYSRGNRAPEVDLIYSPEKITVRVTDFGRGIPPEDIKNLFQAFFRADNIQDIEGTGLGLVVCKKYIELLEGKIWVESELNKQTTFTIELPNKK